MTIDKLPFLRRRTLIREVHSAEFRHGS